VNERQLRSFILSADEKSFSKAANRSFISAPALIQQINLLETSLGFKLFHRSHTGIELTESGKIFYQSSVQILALYDNAIAQCLELENYKDTVLRIGYTQELFPQFFIQILDDFTKKHPEITTQFCSYHFADFFDSIRENKIDIAILTEPSKQYLNGLKFFPIKREKFAFCMKPDNPLAKKELLHLEDLKDVTILCGRTNYMKKPFENYFKNIGNLIVTNENYDLTKELGQLNQRNVYLITNEWKNFHETFLKVVSSDIDSGMIGILYNENTPAHVKSFLDFWKKNCELPIT
jgi:DNA-binding transcriptional LysR family regulator